MANLIDLFTSKIDKDNIIGENNFFNNEKELTEFSKLQRKFISNVDYSDPKNFAKFGSAEEYYKTAIQYIDYRSVRYRQFHRHYHMKPYL